LGAWLASQPINQKTSQATSNLFQYFMKKNLISFLGAVAVLAVSILASCTKSSPFGSELLEEEAANLRFTDTVTVNCTIERDDDIITADRNSTADYFLCGQLNDPTFGRHSAEIFTLFRLNSFSPNFKNTDGTPATLDSVHLYLRLDAPGIYGDTAQMQTLEVLQVNAGNRIYVDSSYFSTYSLPADNLIASGTFTIKPSKSDSLIWGSGSSREFVGKAPFLKFNIDKNSAFARSIFEYDVDADSLAFASDSAFYDKFRGLKIRNTTPGGNLMLGLDLNNTTFSRFVFFFTKRTATDTLQARYEMRLTGGNKFVHFKHDYSGTPVETALADPNPEFIYLQGMGGLRARIDFPYAKHLLDSGLILINQAELEMTTAAAQGSPEYYTPNRQLLLLDTSLIAISDLTDAAGPLLTQGFGSFGGFPFETKVNGNKAYRYNLLLTRRFQGIVDQTTGGLKGTTLVMPVYPRSISPQRTIFYGRKSATFPIKLKLKYTRL
jgi:hypothetical protein